MGLKQNWVDLWVEEFQFSVPFQFCRLILDACGCRLKREPALEQQALSRGSHQGVDEREGGLGLNHGQSSVSQGGKSGA